MPDLTPEEEQVRRLLADARHTEPMPDDVAARLDRVLADLGDEAAPARRPVVDLAARRRRRTVRTVLVAAVAVVAVGFGISRVGDLTSTGSADNSSAGSSADKSQPEAGAGAGGAMLVLTAGGFDDAVRDFVASGAADSSTSRGDSTMSLAACDGAGPGIRVPVVYDGADAVLVVRPARAGSRVAALYRCGETTPLRTTTVPVR